MIPSPYRGIRAGVVWMLSLSLMLSPLLAQAHLHAGQPAPAAVEGDTMPCHQIQIKQAQAPKPACPHCEQNGKSLQCDCCDLAFSPTLPSGANVRVGLTRLLTQISGFKPPPRPDPLPTFHYRPPILVRTGA